jgi:hypothetical protein
MFNNTKYTKIYNQIISTARTRKYDCYTENHHILPEAMGGTLDPENMVIIPAREHFICHWLLTKMVTGSNKVKMEYALNGMKRTNEHQERYETKITSRVYARLKEIVAKNHSEFMKGRIPWNKGLPMDEKQKDKIRATKKSNPHIKTQEEIDKRVAKILGQKRTAEQRANMSNGMKGIKKGPMSDDDKQKRSVTLKGRPKAAESTAKRAATLKKLAAEGKHHSQIKLICPHCGTEMQKILYARYHGDKCKFKPQ